METGEEDESPVAAGVGRLTVDQERQDGQVDDDVHSPEVPGHLGQGPHHQLTHHGCDPQVRQQNATVIGGVS